MKLPISTASATVAASKIVAAIDEYCVKTYNKGHREHLGASIIGRKCPRRLWYTFRWVKRPVFSGRTLRLFDRGHREEPRFLEWLRGVGFTVQNVESDGAQIRIAGVEGHFGGSLDGRTAIPEWLSELSGAGDFLLEFKTSRTGRTFNDLSTKGVENAQPVHYAQMCMYGAKHNLDYAIYMCINKNDDDLYVEIVALNPQFAKELETKAHNVITAQAPPERISASPAWFDCKWCDYLDNCHHSLPSEKNCRSCVHAKPIADAQWQCGLAPESGAIPADFIPVGCGQWQDIAACS